MNRLWLCFILVVLLVGCTGQGKSTEVSSFTVVSPSLSPTTITPTRTIAPAFTYSETATIRPTETTNPTVLSPTYTEYPGFPIPLTDSSVIQHCLTINDHPPTGTELNGKLVLGNRLPDVDPYLLNLENNERYEIPFSTGRQNLWLDYAIVSPNGNWLTYVEILEQTHAHRLHLMSADLQEQPYLDLQDGWGLLVNWLDDQRLLLSTAVSTMPEGVWPRGEMAVLSPFSRDWEILSPNPPLEISIDPMPWYYWPNNPIVLYDPSLTRAVYLSQSGFLLIDAQTQNTILSISTQNYMSRPRWSPQGDSFAMVIDNAEYPEYRSEIYQFDHEGQSTPITSLAESYGDNNVDIESFNWSPDGNKIAFTYFVNDMMTNEHFAVVDVGTGQVVDYCLPSVGLLPPIWSPDSRQVAFASATTAELNEVVYWRTVIVDIVKGYAVQVAETMLPLGWMVAP